MQLVDKILLKLGHGLGLPSRYKALKKIGAVSAGARGACRGYLAVLLCFDVHCSSKLLAVRVTGPASACIISSMSQGTREQ